MSARVELWGFPTGDVEKARRVAERVLGVSFRPMTSLHIGPYLFAILGDGAAELTLRPNVDPEFDPETDDEQEAFAEPDFPESGVLLYVDWTFEDAAARAKLETFRAEAQLLAIEEEGDGDE